ncbi:MAG: hypothetical protein GOV02_04385, partial [Candidatus Aenigmarchaeota archaeon]|nr:hypothetical protein [Candidatus Aenigmarchaeota archaeon]
LSIIIVAFFSACATTGNTPRYTTINPNADFSEIKTLAFSPYNVEDDSFSLKNTITHELIKLGFNVIDTEKYPGIPDAIVKFDYANYRQTEIRATGFSLRAGRYYLLDSFTIQFLDNITGDIILSSNFPKAVHIMKANKVVQVLFIDIESAIKTHNQPQL